ncbi:hypothetical protein PVT71_20220 [Salipiger sp. H15]|uniref:Uncharacterized protein n=1 Tax=Alloyangia sp. H15 TaxID=3029062 RepID=A0AAU8AKD3_9RHOB
MDVLSSGNQPDGDDVVASGRFGSIQFSDHQPGDGADSTDDGDDWNLEVG